MRSLIFFLLLAGTIHSNAQSAKDSVVAAVNKLFVAMKSADTALLRECFTANAVFQTIKEDNGSAVVSDEPLAGFSSFLAKEAPGNADERITIDRVLIDGPLALAWTPYQFYYKGKFSHCGVNSFQLVRGKAGWKIQYIIDTRRKEGCL
jgi:hypothetical protein